jgi:hypothetical protein
MASDNTIEPVYITDLDGNVIDGLYLTEIDSRMATRLISAPVEDGSVRFDNKVVEPEAVIVKGFITTKGADNIISTLHAMKNSRDMKFCKVFSKFDVYENLAVEEFSIQDTSDKYDVSTVTIRLKQIIVTKASGGSSYCGSKNFVPA